MERLGVGVDLGATRVRLCVGDRSGKIKWRTAEMMPVPREPREYVAGLSRLVEIAIGRAGGREKVAGVGLASIGPLDLDDGSMVSPANLPYARVRLVRPISDAVGLPVRLVNDANAGALGEHRFGAGRRLDDLVYVTISTGIGGGAIVDGNLLSGKDGNAAEIGHFVVDPDGRLECGCGRRGHWEAYCSGTGIPKLAALMAEDTGEEGKASTVRGRSAAWDPATILRAASKGSGFARMVVQEMGRLNAVGFADVVDSYDPSLVTVGGGVALNNGELVLGPVRKLLPSLAINRVPEVRLTPLGDDAGLLGALSLALEG